MASIYWIILCLGFTVTITMLLFTVFSYYTTSAWDNGKYKYDLRLFIDYFQLNRGYFLLNLSPVLFCFLVFGVYFLAKIKQIIFERQILLGNNFFS